MSLRKLLTLFIVLMALGTTSSWASCTRLSSPTVMLDMVVGRVVVPPDLPVGSVILTRDWTMSAPGGASYRCTSGTNRFAAKIVSPGATDLGNKIYSTNVPGIGMRFSRGGATVNIVYPTSFRPGYITPPIIPSKGRALRWRLSKPRQPPAAAPWRRVSTPPTTGRAAVTRSSKPI
uniref:MrkDV1 n=1 Tax=Klebsiella pneumoniae TaxID=573 RepID=Q6XLN6_KLEPN|nr:MrkDV1 [Klebsiella pneumoniae]